MPSCFAVRNQAIFNTRVLAKYTVNLYFGNFLALDYANICNWPNFILNSMLNLNLMPKAAIALRWGHNQSPKHLIDVKELVQHDLYLILLELVFIYWNISGVSLNESIVRSPNITSWTMQE